MKGPIGVFDSGIGGLTVLREIERLLPHEDTIYLGDTARVPYGTKSRETVMRYAVENARYLLNEKIKLLVVACNTASAFAIDTLRQTLDIPVVGVIEPGARKAVEVARTRRVGVIGTEGTIRSGAYFDAIKRLDAKVAVFTKPCPLFVPLAEEGWLDNKVARITAEHYLQDLLKEWVDTLVLGCTHYPLLKGVIGEVMGREVLLIDSAEETAVEVKRVLEEEKILKKRAVGQGNHTFYVTDSPGRFIAVGRRFLGGVLDRVKLVTVEG
ncbi:MAG: glutamate racemase [Thermodesulfobacteriota bacterium]